MWSSKASMAASIRPTETFSRQPARHWTPLLNGSFSEGKANLTWTAGGNRCFCAGLMELLRQSTCVRPERLYDWEWEESLHAAAAGLSWHESLPTRVALSISLLYDVHSLPCCVLRWHYAVVSGQCQFVVASEDPSCNFAWLCCLYCFALLGIAWADGAKHLIRLLERKKTIKKQKTKWQNRLLKKTKIQQVPGGVGRAACEKGKIEAHNSFTIHQVAVRSPQ